MDRRAEQLHKAIGQRLQELRRANTSLSQEGLAARAGFHRTFVGKAERGETAVTVDTLAALCAALNVSIAEFFQPFDEIISIRGPRRRRPRA